MTYHIAGKFGGELDFQTAAPILLVYVDTYTQSAYVEGCKVSSYINLWHSM